MKHELEFVKAYGLAWDDPTTNGTRDYWRYTFAAAALQGLCAAPPQPGNTDIAMVGLAAALADALLAELEEEPRRPYAK